MESESSSDDSSDFGSSRTHISELWSRLLANDAGDISRRDRRTSSGGSRSSSRSSRGAGGGQTGRASFRSARSGQSGVSSKSSSRSRHAEETQLRSRPNYKEGGIYTIKASEKVERMGWAPSAWPPNKVFVGSVTTSWASSHGIGVGDELVEIGGRRPKDMAKADLVAIIQQRPISMTFKRHPLEDSDAELEKWDGEKKAAADAQEEKEEQASIQTLIVIEHANDLTPLDENGFADPYVVCSVPSNPELKFTTKAKKKTLNPEWRHREVMYGISGETDLEFAVWDVDKEEGGKDLLGFAQLVAAMFWPDGFEGDLTLEGGGTLHVIIEPGHGDDDSPMKEKTKKGKKLPDDAFEIVLQGDKRMGFTPTAMPPEPVFLDNVENLGWAADNGLRPGDELVGIDGLLITKMKPQDFLKALQTRPARLAFRRSPGAGPVEVTIVSAKNLRSADFMGKSDPFCVCEVPGKPSLKFQTICVNDTSEPIWNCTELLDCAAYDNIDFKVYDKDLRGQELLGGVVLDHTQYRPDGFDGTLELEDAGEGACLIVRVKMLEDKYSLAPPDPNKKFEVLVPEHTTKMGWTPTCLPPQDVLVKEIHPGGWAERNGIHVQDQLVSIEGRKVENMKDVTFMKHMKQRPLKLTFSRKTNKMTQGGRIRILVKGARGLRSAKADPYAVCEVPSRPEAKFQTPVQSRTKDPVWNYRHELWNAKTVPFLQFSIWDEEKGKQGELLGKVTVDKGKFWPHGFDGELVLRESRTKADATLQLTIEVLADELGSDKPLAREYIATEFVKNLGFRPASMPPDRVFVEDVQPATWASSQGVLKGDELVEIEGTRCVDLNEKDFKAAMQLRPLRLAFVTPEKKKDDSKFKKKVETRPIEVVVEEARDLRQADLGGCSDPYCEVQVMGRPGTLITTPVCENSLNPIWHYKNVIRDCQADDVLAFSVFDKDPGRKGDLLGKGFLPITVFWPGAHQEAMLLEETKGKKSWLHISLKVLEEKDVPVVPVYKKMFSLTAKAGQDTLGFRTTGEPPNPIIVDEVRKGGWAAVGEVEKGDILIAVDGEQSQMMSKESLVEGMKKRPLRLQFARPTVQDKESDTDKDGVEADDPRWREDTNWLVVTIVSAKNLRQADWLGASDPFVSCEIPGLPGYSFQTEVLNNTANPVWNHEQGLGKVPVKAPLKFSVFDSDPGGKKDLLGKVLLPSEQYYPDGFRGDLVLEASKRGDLATLRVQVEVMKEDLQANAELERKAAERAVDDRPDEEKEEWEFLMKDEADEIFGRAAEGQYELRADYTIESMGWGPSGMPPERVLVREVRHGGWADKRGMQVGDELVKMEGRLVKDIPKQHLVRIFNLRPISMIFERGGGGEMSEHELADTKIPARSATREKGYSLDIHNLHEGVFEVVAKKGVTVLGLQTSGMPPARIFIASVKPKTWAGRSGLREHDEIAEINGCTASAVGDFLGSLQARPLRLLICRVAGAGKHMNEDEDDSPVVLAEIFVPTGSRLGWMPSGLPPDPVRVLKVEQESSAYRHNVRKGDELVKINGLDVDDLTKDRFMKEMNARPLKLTFKLQGDHDDNVASKHQDLTEAEVDSDIMPDWDVAVKDIVGYDSAQVEKMLDFVMISFSGEVDGYKLTEALDFKHARNMAFISMTPLSRNSTVEHCGSGSQDVVLKVFIATQDQNTYGFKYVGFAHAMQPMKRSIPIIADGEYRTGYFLGLEVHRNLNKPVFSLKGAEVAQQYVRNCLQESVQVGNGVLLEVLPESCDFVASFAVQDSSGTNAMLKFLCNVGAKSGPWGAYPKKLKLCTAFSLGLGKHFQGTVELCFGRIDFGLQPADFSGQWFWEYAKASRRTSHGVLILHTGSSDAVRDSVADLVQSRSQDLRGVDDSRLWIFDQRNQRVFHLNQYYSIEMRTGSQVTRAASLGDADAVFNLVWEDAGAVQARDGSGRTPLHIAATKGNAGVVGWLLRAHAAINALDRTHETPLYNAAAEGHREIVQLLLDAHADTEIRSLTGRTPFRVAVERDHGQCSSLLRNSEDPEFNTAGFMKSRAVAAQATLQNDVHLLDDILQHDPRAIRATDGYGKSLLHVAAQCGHVKLAEFILDRNGNVNCRDHQKLTPLHSAANEGRMGMVRMLLTKQADIEARAQGGYTALDCAILQARLLVKKKQIPQNFSNTIRLLRSAGAPESDLRREELLRLEVGI